MAKTDYESIDQYIASRHAGARDALERVRRTIHKAIPRAVEAISYQIAAFKLEGRVLIFFAGWKDHYSLYPATARVVSTFERELAPYEVTKGTIRFPLSKAVPTKLIASIAKVRATEVLEREAEKKAGKAAKTKRPSATNPPAKGKHSAKAGVRVAAKARAKGPPKRHVCRRRLPSPSRRHRRRRGSRSAYPS